MVEERWRPVTGYEGLYEVSNTGLVRSLKRSTTCGKVLRGIPDKDGYLHVCLCSSNVKKRFAIHRLVADAFVEGKTDENTIVNHINENKTDNKATNLEWCTIGYNTRFGNGIEKRAKKRRIPIKAISETETLTFDSITQAANMLGVSHGNISGCLSGYYGRHTCKGYSFTRG